MTQYDEDETKFRANLARGADFDPDAMNLRSLWGARFDPPIESTPDTPWSHPVMTFLSGVAFGIGLSTLIVWLVR